MTKIYQSLAEGLAHLFAPMLEVALLDARDEVVCLYNRLANEELPKIESGKPIRLVINKNQPVKCLYVPLEKGFALRLIADLSLFEPLQAFLQRYLTQEIAKETADWQQIVDGVIQAYLEQHNTTLGALNAKGMRALILHIHEKKLFRYQDASKYLAGKLQVSRATIYNYLKQASKFKSLEVHQVDSFTDEPFSGNPAGVVLEADNLSEAMMKKIAREMNLSETSFVLQSKKADIRLRYFTPTGHEVKFCGHSTVGALYMLAHKQLLGITKPGRYELTFEAKVGTIAACLALKPDQSITIEFQTPKFDLVASKITHQEAASALGIPLEVVNQKVPVMFEKVNQDLYLSINSLDALGDLLVDQKSAKHFAEKHEIVAYALICTQTLSPDSHIHMRCFAPAVGIPEDPFTGSVLGGLAGYIIKNKLLDARIKTVRIEQGHFISRPGFVDLKLNGEKEPPLVIAKARHFFSTVINL